MMTEKRLLQIVVLIASIVPIGAGFLGIIAGPKAFGAHDHAIDLTSHVGYLSGLLLAIGLVFVFSVPSIERHKTRFLTLGFVVFIGGMARLYEGYSHGFGTLPYQLALVMELIVTPSIVAWQCRIAAKN